MGRSPLWQYFDQVTYNAQKYARCKDGNCESHTSSEMYIKLPADSSTSTSTSHRPLVLLSAGSLMSHHPEIADNEEMSFELR